MTYFSSNRSRNSIMFQVSSDIRAYDSAAFVSSLPPLGGIVIGGVSLFVGSSGLLVGWFVRSKVLRFMRIFAGVRWRGDVKINVSEWGCRKWRFSLLSLAISSEPSHQKPQLGLTPSPTDRGTGYCFRSISLFRCLFVCFCQQEQESCAIAKMTAQCAHTYECPENFRDSLTTPTATIPNIFMGFSSDRPYKCSYKIWSP